MAVHARTEPGRIRAIGGDMNTKTLLIIGGVVLVYMLLVKPKASITVGKVDDNKVSEGFAVANSIYGSVSQLWS